MLTFLDQISSPFSLSYVHKEQRSVGSVLAIRDSLQIIVNLACGVQTAHFVANTAWPWQATIGDEMKIGCGYAVGTGRSAEADRFWRN